MPEQVPALNAIKSCPKCGANGKCSDEYGSLGPQTSFMKRYHRANDCIYRTCRDCEYEWAEACLPEVP